MQQVLVFLMLASLLAASPVASRAQQSALATQVAAGPPDTVAAIHRLFVARRKRQGYATGATALVAIGTLITLTSSQPARTSGSSGSGFAVIGPNDLGQLAAAFVTLPLIPAVALGLGGWGHRREHQAVAAFEAHQLPRHLRRQLKPRYFY